jgi:multiple sugar transport system permease protein
MKTVQLGLAGFRRENTTEWPLMMAVTLVATLPVLLAFVLGQRYFTRGIALTGLKG